MERIVESPDWIATSALKWSSVVDKIVQQADMEAEHCKAVRDKMKEMSEYGMMVYNLWSLYNVTVHLYIYLEDNHILAFALLPLLLPDARTKPDSEKVIYFTEVRM